MLMEKSLGRVYRETIKKDLKKDLKGSSNFFIGHYRGLKSAEITQLRKELKKVGANVSVVRNRLSQPLLEELELKAVKDGIKGPTAFIFASSDPVVVAKALLNFSKEHEKLEVELAYIDKKILDKSGIKELSTMPSKEVLLARVVGGIKAPLNGLVNCLNGNLRKIVYVLNAIVKSKKE